MRRNSQAVPFLYAYAKVGKSGPIPISPGRLQRTGCGCEVFNGFVFAWLYSVISSSLSLRVLLPSDIQKGQHCLFSS